MWDKRWVSAVEELKLILTRLVEEGRLKEVVELALEALWEPLFRLIEENSKAIADLRLRTEENTRAVAGLREQVEENAKLILELGRRTEELLEAVSGLRASIAELKPRTEENLRAISELRKSISELRSSLEAERDIRRGSLARLEGLITQVRLISGLRSWCSSYGLRLEELPAEPYRVDAVIVGERLLALVEVARTGEEADIEQLLEGARIYECLRGEKPNALVLYIYAEKPPAWLVEEARKHDIIVDNSPRRLAKRLAELDKQMKRVGPGG